MFYSGRLSVAAFACAFAIAQSAYKTPLAHAQVSDIEREWRLVQQAQAAHGRGRVAAERGDRATADGELQTAAAYYRQLIEDNPLRRDLYAPLADTLIRRGNAAAAYALLVQQTREGNKERVVHLQLVRALAGMRRYRHALEAAQKLAQKEPHDPVLQALLGMAAAEAGEPELAMKALGQVLGQPPTAVELRDIGLDLPTLRLSRARLLLSAQRSSEAAADLAELAKAQQPEALFLLGQAYLESGRVNDAISALQRCVALPAATAGPFRSRATAMLAQALLQSGRTKDAISVLRQAGDDSTVLLALAQMYLNDQPPNPAAALLVIERATERDPGDPRLCFERASLYEQTGRTPAAQSEFERCLKLAVPTGTEAALEAQLFRADVELRLNRLDDGIANLRSIMNRPLGAVQSKALGAQPLSLRLAQALLQRGLKELKATPPSAQALADLQEAHRLTPSALTAHGLALALLGNGQPREALSLLAPLAQNGPSANDPRLLGAYGRALRESDQTAEALPVLKRAETLLSAGAPNPPLRAALRAEQAAVLIALEKPMEALKLTEGNEPASARARGQAYLATVRAFYATAAATVTRSPAATPPSRGPFPQLRGPHDQPQAPQPGQPGKLPLRLAEKPRGPFPPLRAGLEPSDTMAQEASSATSPQGLSDERQVLFYAQQALRSGTLSQSERGEAMLYQVVALVHGGQYALALKLLGEVAAQIDPSTLDALLGPGSFAELKARVTLRGGDFYAGITLAQQALPLLKPQAARALQTTMAVAYTNKAIEVMERNQPDRVNLLLRNAWEKVHGGSAENLSRANYNLAVLQLHRGKLEDARAALGRLDPQQLPEVWIGIGSYYDLLGDGRAAMENYRRYLQAAVPGDPQLSRVHQWVDLLERIHAGEQP